MEEFGIIYLQSVLEIEQIVEILKKAINVEGFNSEKREGLNIGGGIYYRLKFMGLSVALVRNKGEVLEEDYQDYEYYLNVESLQDIDENLFSFLINHIYRILQSEGFKCIFRYPV